MDDDERRVLSESYERDLRSLRASLAERDTMLADANQRAHRAEAALEAARADLRAAAEANRLAHESARANASDSAKLRRLLATFKEPESLELAAE